jgi:tRNA threonylcarbamoyladenosine biosynthesis protein TsaE
MKKKFISKSIQETRSLAKALVASLQSGGVVALMGELGAGKTAFTQGLAKALGVKTVVNSPTFVLMKVYEARHKSIKQLVHIDAYRLESAEDLVELGVLEYMADPEVLVVIEWAERVKSIIPKGSNSLKFKSLAEGEKEIVWTN